MRRPKHIRQAADNECGAAALALVAAHHGLRITVAQARQLTRTDRNGATLLGLAVAGESLGFEVSGLRATWKHLRDLPLPLIARVRNDNREGHFVVVEEVRDGWIVVSDPEASGPTEWTRERFERVWNGCVLCLESSGGLAARVKPAPTLMTFMWLALPDWRVGLAALAAAIVAMGLGMSVAFFVQYLLDGVLLGGTAGSLPYVAAGMLVLLATRSGLGVLRRFLLLRLGQRLDAKLQHAYYARVLRLPMEFFASRQSGEVVSRMGDARSVSALLTGTLVAVLLDGLLLTLTLGVMFWMNWRLALVSLGIVPLLVGILAAFQPRIRRLQRATMRQAADLQGHMVDFLQGMSVIKAYGAEDEMEGKMTKEVEGLLGVVFDQGIAASAMEACSAALSGAATVFVLWYGAHQVMSGTFTLGQLMSFNVLLAYMLGPVETLAGANLAVQEAAIAADRVGEVVGLATEDEDRSAESIVPGPARTNIEFRDVSFGYSHGRPVLDEVSLEVADGATVAIVGESGSGKTTICRLLARFHDHSRGEIRVGGQKHTNYGLAELRSAIGWVDQECVMFGGSIADNIAIGTPEATRAEVEVAARRAHADGFINDLPDGYDTRVGERGASLSGGQRQRIAIARALLRDPPILLLDEATSHLDSLTEAAIHAEIRRDASNGRPRTTVIVAHRLSSVRHADEIVVLAAGRVVERGTHDEMVARRGSYWELWLHQEGLAAA